MCGLCFMDFVEFNSDTFSLQFMLLILLCLHVNKYHKMCKKVTYKIMYKDKSITVLWMQNVELFALQLILMSNSAHYMILSVLDALPKAL